VHPAEIFASRQLLIERLRLRQQDLARPERDDRVDARVHAIDLIEIRLHHLDTQDLS
jgi:hypothetical protein